MKFHFTVISQLVLEHEQGDKQSKHVATNYNLETSAGIDINQYVKDGDLLKPGTKIATEVLLNALMANIHYAHEAGHKDSAEHFREVIKKMEDIFITVPTIKKSHLL